LSRCSNPFGSAISARSWTGFQTPIVVALSERRTNSSGRAPAPRAVCGALSKELQTKRTHIFLFIAEKLILHTIPKSRGMRDERQELLRNGRKFLDARSPNGVCHANVNKEMIVKVRLIWRLFLGSCAAGLLGMHFQAAAFAQVPAPPITPNPAPPIRPNPAPPITPNPAPPITPNPALPITPNPALPIESPTPTPKITPLPP